MSALYCANLSVLFIHNTFKQSWYEIMKPPVTCLSTQPHTGKSHEGLENNGFKQKHRELPFMTTWESDN